MSEDPGVGVGWGMVDSCTSNLINKNATRKSIFAVKAKAGTTIGLLVDLREKSSKGPFF